ncbi:MAG: YeeE/YedE family protein [Paracoccaceae bacterium]
MAHTDWLWGFIGGLMIGGAASLYLLMNGRITGISGIYSGLFDRTGWPEPAERLAFVIGLIAVPATLAWAIPGTATHLTANWLVIIAAGLLVGIGTCLANGCTSGHGVCGMSRLSLRSILATALYVAAGGITMALLRHVLAVI